MKPPEMQLSITLITLFNLLILIHPVQQSSIKSAQSPTTTSLFKLMTSENEVLSSHVKAQTTTINGFSSRPQLSTSNPILVDNNNNNNNDNNDFDSIVANVAIENDDEIEEDVQIESPEKLDFDKSIMANTDENVLLFRQQSPDANEEETRERGTPKNHDKEDKDADIVQIIMKRIWIPCRTEWGIELPFDVYVLDTCARCYHYMPDTAFRFGAKFSYLKFGHLFHPDRNLTLASNETLILSHTFNSISMVYKWQQCCTDAILCCINHFHKFYSDEQLFNDNLTLPLTSMANHSQEQQHHHHHHLRQYDGYCPPTWDGWLCWDDYARPNQLMERPCPKHIYWHQRVPPCRGYVTKLCNSSGHWFQNQDHHEWSNYTMCARDDIYARRIKYSLVTNIISMIALIPALIIFIHYKQVSSISRIRLHKHLFTSLLFHAIISALLKWHLLDASNSEGVVITEEAILVQKPSLSSTIDPFYFSTTTTQPTPTTATSTVNYDSTTMDQATNWIETTTLHSSIDSNTASQKIIQAGIKLPPFCLILSIMQRYFRSTTYLWMFNEALYLHQLIRHAFTQPSLRPLIILAYGLPFITTTSYILARSYLLQISFDGTSSVAVHRNSVSDPTSSSSNNNNAKIVSRSMDQNNDQNTTESISTDSLLTTPYLANNLGNEPESSFLMFEQQKQQNYSNGLHRHRMDHNLIQQVLIRMLDNDLVQKADWSKKHWKTERRRRRKKRKSKLSSRFADDHQFWPPPAPDTGPDIDQQQQEPTEISLGTFGSETSPTIINADSFKERSQLVDEDPCWLTPSIQWHELIINGPNLAILIINCFFLVWLLRVLCIKAAASALHSPPTFSSMNHNNNSNNGSFGSINRRPSHPSMQPHSSTNTRCRHTQQHDQQQQKHTASPFNRNSCSITTNSEGTIPATVNYAPSVASTSAASVASNIQDPPAQSLNPTISNGSTANDNVSIESASFSQQAYRNLNETITQTSSIVSTPRFQTSIRYYYNHRPLLFNRKSFLVSLRAAVVLLPLYGLHYLFIVSRPEFETCWLSETYHYLSSSFDGLQGLMVSIIFCFANSEIRILLKRSVQRVSNRQRSLTIYMTEAGQPTTTVNQD